MIDVSHDFSRRALDLSLAVYRITGRFPNGETLVGQLRELGSEIAGDLATGEIANLDKKINRLRAYFKIAQAQNWVARINWQILDLEYYKLEQEVLLEQKKSGAAEKETAISITSHNVRAENKPVSRRAPVSASRAQGNSRQNKIMAALDKKEPLKMSNLIPLFKDDISERTLRNELQAMVKNGLLRKSGLNKATVYYKG